MQADEKQSLIEKIEALPPDLRERVEGYVDALLEGRRADSRQGDGQGRSGEGESSEGGRDRDVEYLDLSFRGALRHLRDQYTSVELQHEIRDEWRKQIDDS